MRFACLAIVAATLFTVPAVSQAAPLGPAVSDSAEHTGFQQVDRRCGRHRHFVPGHRWHHRYVPGHCQRN